jgi:hypothetical protein
MRLDNAGNLVPFTNNDCVFGNVVGQAVFGPSGGGTWDPLRPTFDTTGLIKGILTAMPRANFFGGGDGLNTAQHAWVRGRTGSNGGLAPRGGDPFVNRKQINVKSTRISASTGSVGAGRRSMITATILSLPGRTA